MNVLVTGAAGFLGRHIIQRLLADGMAVSAFDRAHLSDPEVRFVRGDLLDIEQVEAAAQGQDVICHVGAIGDVYLATERPDLAASVNVVGSTNVAAAALRAGARVVYASTWEVYGKPLYEPIDEDHPCNPDHPYNITKLAGEQMLLAAAHLQGLAVLSLRLGTAYGAGLRPNSVFRIFVDRARRREPIVIQGDGSQSRQFTHASDIAAAFSLACRSEATGLALNAVASEPVSIKQLAELVVARFPTEVVFAPARPGDVPPATVSAERIGRVLGWNAQVPFEVGIAQLMDGMVAEG